MLNFLKINISTFLLLKPNYLAEPLEHVDTVVDGALDVVHVVVCGATDHHCGHARLLVADPGMKNV